MTFRVSIGPVMSGGDRAVTIDGQHAAAWVSNGNGGTVHIWGAAIEPAPGKWPWPYDSVAQARGAIIRGLIAAKGNVTKGLQLAARGPYAIEESRA